MSERKVTWVYPPTDEKGEFSIPPTPMVGHGEIYDHQNNSWKHMRRVTRDYDVTPMEEARHQISLCKECGAREAHPERYTSYCLGEKGAHKVFGLSTEQEDILDAEHEEKKLRWEINASYDDGRDDDKRKVYSTKDC
jgi:hypothetical protein